MSRRHDIDCLRIAAFGLLILYHACMLYVAGWDWHLKSTYVTDALRPPMLFLNRWRMDLIFILSGVATAFMMASRPAGAFVRERTFRLLLPLVFGMLVVVPIQPYAQGVANGLVEPGFLRFLGRYFTGYRWPANAFDGWETGFTWNHLWYLPYLFAYTVALVGLEPALRSRPGLAIQRAFVGLRGARLALYPALPLYLFTAMLQHRFPTTHDLVHDFYQHSIYFTVFLYGWWMARDAGIWSELARLRKATLAWALVTFAAYFAFISKMSNDPPEAVYLAGWALRNLYIWLALCAVLGWGHAYLNRPFRWLPIATEAVYPWYVLHQSFIIAIAFWLVPLKVGPVTEPLIVILGTIAGCAVVHTLVRRNDLLAACFGIRRALRRRSEVRVGVGATSTDIAR